MSKKSLAARLLTRAFRTARPDPIRKPATKPQGAVGGRIEELEDRSVPALLSYYQAEGNGTDAVGGRNGTLGTTTTFATGQVGQAFSFDGVPTSQVTVAPAAAFDFTTGTVAGWINAPLNAQNEAIFSMRTSLAGTRWSIHVNESANQIGIYNGSSYNPVPVGGAGIVPGNWHHVAAVMTTTSTAFYLDGALVGSVPFGLNNAETGKPFVIGGANDPGFPHETFAGLIDEVKVFNHALSPAEVLALTVPDTTAPTVTAINLLSPNPTNAGTVQFEVVFSEPMQTLTTTDFFAVAGSGLTGNTTSGVTGSGTTWVVTVSTGFGSGTLPIQVQTTAKDLAGNALAAAVTSAAYTVDRTTAAVVGNDLVLTDPGSRNDAFGVSYDGTNFTITGNSPINLPFALGGTAGNGATTVVVPASAFTGKIVFNTGTGDDTVTVTHTGTAVPRGIDFLGGTGGNDTLAVVGAPFGAHVLNYTNATDGSIVVPGAGTITYTGLDPITYTSLGGTLQVNMTAVGDDIAVSVSGSNLVLAGATVETTTFDLTGITAIEFNGMGGTDKVTLNSPLTQAVAFNVEEVVLNAAVTGTVTGTATTVQVNAGASIQDGVDAAAAGATVTVAAGTFRELIDIGKPITLRGANFGNSAQGAANRAARVAPTIVQPLATGNAVGVRVLSTGGGTTIDGFDFLGAGLVGGEYAQVQVFAPNVTFRNNVSNSQLNDPFQPGGQNAIGLLTGLGTNFSGLLIENSFFARQRNGVFLNPTSAVTAITIQNNEFASRTGVNSDISNSGQVWNAALVYTLSGNTLGLTTVDGLPFGPVTGFNVGEVTAGMTVNVTGNSISTNSQGLRLASVLSGGTVNVTGNTFTDHTNGAIGLRSNAAAGSNVVATGNTFRNVVFVSNEGAAGLTLSANSVNLGAGDLTLASASLAQLYSVADRVFDAVDVGAFGHVRLRAGNVYVTPNSFISPTTTTPSLQRGVSAATSGDTVNVQAGTYPDAAVGVSQAALTILGTPGAVLTGTLSATSTGAFSVTDLATGSGTVSAANPFTLASTNTVGGTYAVTATTVTRTVDQPAGPYTVTGSAAVVVTGGGGTDSFNVTSYASGPALTVNGGAGTDTLTYDAGGVNPTVTGTQITAPGRVTVNYTGIENIVLQNVGVFVLTGDGAANNVVVRRSGTTDLQYMIDGGPWITLLNPTSFAFDGAAGNDTLTVDYSAGVFAQPVTYDGQTPTTGPGDKLVTTGGSFATATHTFTNASSGTIQYTGAGLITYSGLEPVDESGIVVPVRVFNLPTLGTNTATLTNTGANLLFSSVGPTFEAVTFANPATSLTINRGTATDALTVDAATNLNTALTAGLGAAFATVTVQNGALGLTSASLTAGTIAVNAAVTANGGITLIAGTSATQSAALSTTGTLTLGGAGNGGTYTLTNTSNTIGTLTATTTGGASVTDSAGGLVLAGGNVTGVYTLTTTGGLTQSAAVTAGTLSATNNGTGGIVLNTSSNPIGTFTATNNASGAVSVLFSAAGTIGGITAAGGAVSADSAAGTDIALTGNIASGGGTVSFPTNAGRLTVAAAAVSVSTAGADLTVGRGIQSLTDLTANALTLDAGATGNVSFGTVNVAGQRLLGLTITNANNVTGGAVTTGAGGITQSAGSGTTTLASLSVLGGGSIALTGTNFSLSGLSVTGAGTIGLTHTGANSLSVTGTVTLGASGVLTDSATTAATTGIISGAIGGSGTAKVVKAGPGTLSLTAANAYPGGTDATGGVIVGLVGGTVAAPTNPFGPGTITIAGGTVRYDRTATLDAGIVRKTVNLGTSVSNTTAVDYDAAGTTVVDAQINYTPPATAAGQGSRWTGLLNVTTAGNYTFRTRSDDGSRLYIDGVLVVTNDGSHGQQDRTSVAIPLTTGLHSVLYYYVEGSAGGGGLANFQYSGPDQATMGLVPAARLFQAVPVALPNAVTVTSAGGGIDVVGNMPGLTLGALSLSTTGANTFAVTAATGRRIDFASTALTATGGTVTLSTDRFVGLGVVSDGANTGISLVKQGAGQLFLDNTSATGNDLNGTTLRLQAGRLVNMGSGAGGATAPMLGAAVQIDGGTLTMESKVNSYTIVNPITVVTSGTVEVVPGNSTLQHSTGLVTVNAGQTLTLHSFGGNSQTRGGLLQFNSQITGAGNLLKTNVQTNDEVNPANTGFVRLSNNTNNFTGSVTVAGGTLIAAVNNALGAATAATTDDTVVQSGAQLRIENNTTIPAGETITIAGDGPGTGGALRNEAGNPAVVSDQVILSANARITGNSNTLTLNGNIAAGTFTVTLDGGGAVVQGAASVLSGTAASAVVKAGGGTATLNGTNTYTGTTTINAGVLQVSSDANLGTAPGVFAANNIIFSGNSTLRATTSFALGATRGITLNSNVTGSLDVNVAGNTFTVGGAANTITGAGHLVKSGPGTVVLTSASNYAGLTTVAAGTLRVTNAAALGGATTGTTVSSGATLDLVGPLTLSAEPLSLVGTGVGGGGALVGSGGVTVPGRVGLSGDATITSATAGSALGLTGAFFKAVSANVTFAGAGDTLVAGAIADADYTLAPFTALAFNGVQQAINDPAVITNDFNGTTAPTRSATLNGPLTFANAAAFNALFTPSLPLGDNFTTVFFTTLTVNTAGTYSFAVTNNDDGAAVWLKPAANAAFVAGDLLQGIVPNSNTAKVTRALTPGTYTLLYAHREGSGGEAVTGRFQGPVLLDPADATLLPIVNPAAVAGGPNNLIKTGTGTLTLTGANTYTGTTTVSAGTLQLGNATAGGSFGTGNVVNNAAVVFNRTDTYALANAISGSGTVSQIGSGTTSLNATNTYTGTTNVTAGRLDINGSVTSNVTVNGGVLGGTGTINSANTLTLNTGSVAPGTSPGILNSGSVTFTGGTFQVEVTGTTVGTQYDQLNVTGTVALGAGTTALSLPTPTFTAGATYTIINNDLGENVTGFFTGLPEGAEVGTFSGVTVYITYAGGDGNDVQLVTTPTFNGTTGDDTIILRQVSGSPGFYEIQLNALPFAPLGAITTLTVNGLGGDDTFIIDGVFGNPFLTGGITYNGGAHTSPNPGDQLQVIDGTYTTITHNFLTASSGNIDFDGRVVNYTGLEPVLVNVGTVTDVIFNLPAAASDAVLEDDGTPANDLSRLRSANGTFEVTTFNNPTGSVTINHGNAADTLTVTAVPDLTSTLTIGTGANPFATLGVTGAVSLGTDKSFTSFGTTTTIGAPVSVAGTGAVSMTAGQSAAISANVTGGTGGTTITGGTAPGAANTTGVTVSGGAVVTATGAGAVAVTGTGGGNPASGGGNHGVSILGAGTQVTSGGGNVTVTGTGGTSGGGNFGVNMPDGGVITSGGDGTVTVTASAGTNTGAGAQRHGLFIRGGSDITSGGAGGVTVSGFGGLNSGGGSFGVNMLDAGTTITSGGGVVSVSGTGGTGAGGFNLGVVVDLGADILSGGDGSVTVTGTGGGAGALNWGVYTQGAGSTITAGGAGTVTVVGQGGTTGTGNDNHGVLVAQSSQITSSGGLVTVTGTGGGTGGASTNNLGVTVQTGGSIVAPSDLTVSGTRGANTATGISVAGAGQTITAAGLATLNGPSASNILVDSAATANFGSITASAAGATVTIFEDSTTAVNTITATTINLTSAGAITDNNVAANNLTGTTATLDAAGGIDLDTTLGSLIATTSLPGNILIDELDAITLTNVTSADGNITITAGGTVSAVNVVDALDAAHVVSITTTAGDILVGNVVATGDTVTLNAAGAILELGPADPAADVTAHVITMTAVTGIGFTGTVEIDTITNPGRGLTASVTGTGLINLADTAGGLRVESATTANGSITITADSGDMIVETVTAGTASAVNLSTTTSGSILDDDVNGTRVTGGVVTLTAAGSIGTNASANSQIDTAAASITASAGGAAGVWIGEQDAVTLTSVTATAGPAVVVSGNTMTVTSVVAAGSAGLSATTGNVLLDTVTAGTFAVVNAAGAVVDNNGAGNNITAPDVLLAATTGVGSANAIETTAGTLAGSNSTSGAFNVANTGSLTITSLVFFTNQLAVSAAGVTNTGGAIDVSTGDGTSSALMTVAVAVSGSGAVVLSSDQNFTLNAGISVASTGGTVTINADVAADTGNNGAAVNINGPITSPLMALGSVTITTGGDADTITVTQTGTSNLDVFAGGIVAPAVGFDQVTVVLGALGTGFVRLNNSGSDNYHATVDGAAQTGPLTLHANTLLNEVNGPLPSPASGVRRVSVNAATVLDYIPAGASLTELSLLGGTAADTYYVQFTDTATDNLSLLPPLVNVTASGAADAAFVYGTNSADTVDVNVGDNDRVTSAGVGVRYDGNLETLTVFGKDEAAQPGDTFAVRPDAQTATTIHGGTPLVYPGDTLELDVLGLVTLNPTFSDPALPAGNFSLTGYPLLSWTSIENFPVPRGMGGSFDFGTATSPVQFGFRQVLPTTTYPAGATAGTGWHGWATTPQYGNQAYSEPNLSPALAASPIANLLRDYAYGWNTPADYGVFRVDVAPNKPVQLTALIGLPVFARDGQVVEWGVANTPTGLPTVWTAITPATGTFTDVGEMVSVSASLSAAQVGNNLSLFVRFRDIAGEPYWSVSMLDVRPTNPNPPMGTLLPAGLVAPLPVRREFSTDGAPIPMAEGGYLNQHAFGALNADGATIDYYRGKDAIPGSLLTVTVTNGTVVDGLFTAPAGDTALASRVLDGDAAGYYRSFQVQADANGEFTFGVRRPTGNNTSTVLVQDVTGFRAGGFTQAFQLPTVRRLDFGPTPPASTQDYGTDGVVGAGYTPFAVGTYTDPGTTALGWAAGTPLPTTFTPAGTGASVVQRDGVFGGYAPSEFVFDMPAGNYIVTATLGDLSARRDDMFVEVYNGSTWEPARGFNPVTGAYDLALTNLTSPPGVSPNAGQSLVRSFPASTSGGQVRVRFGNVTGNPNWTLSALEVRPAPAPTNLVVTRTSPAPTADGTTVSTYTVTGAAAGTVLTVRPALGAAGTDADTTYDGVQVVVPMSGPATFTITAPFSASAISAALVEVESVSGGDRGLFTESYAAASPPPPATAPAVRRFDFNGSATAGVTHASMTGVRGNELWTAGADYGWLSAVGEFERTLASLPASMTADQKALFRDGATLGAVTGTFRVKVPDAGPSATYAVRYYVGDSFRKWPWIRLQVEGGAASGQLPTNVNQYWSYLLNGNDANSDGYLDVKVFGSATWVLNGIDIARGTAANLPPSLFAPSPQLAGFAVTESAGPRLTDAELAPVVAEAVRRWTAAGADPARFANVTVSIQDLNAAGRLGQHVPGSVHIDDDAGGRGWFVDPTPGDDAEFGSAVAVGLGATDTAAARGVDLLTVVMHELGHELGLVDLDAGTAPADLMAESLTPGVRRLPTTAVAPTDVTTVAATTDVTTVTLPTPALWLSKAESVYSPGVPVAATDVRVRVAAEPVFVRTEPTRVALPPVFSTAAVREDADALLDLDGVYVG